MTTLSMRYCISAFNRPMELRFSAVSVCFDDQMTPIDRYFYLSRSGLLSWSQSYNLAHRPSASDEPPLPIHGARIESFRSAFELYICSTQSELEFEISLSPPAVEEGGAAAQPMVLQLRAEKAINRTSWLESLFMVTSAQRLLERGLIPSGILQ